MAVYGLISGSFAQFIRLFLCQYIVVFIFMILSHNFNNSDTSDFVI